MSEFRCHPDDRHFAEDLILMFAEGTRLVLDEGLTKGCLYKYDGERLRRCWEYSCLMNEFTKLDLEQSYDTGREDGYKNALGHVMSTASGCFLAGDDKGAKLLRGLALSMREKLERS